MRLPGMSGRISPTDPRERGRVVPPEQAYLGQTFLGRYKTSRFLGAGSNAHVFLAHPLASPNTSVVVKRIQDHVLSTPRFRQFFDAEVKSMARFAHPYAVRLLDAALDDPLGPCLVLEYVPGVTLEAVLDRHRRLPAERVGRLLGRLCHALDAAHRAGIVHRDLKPANLMAVDADAPTESLKVMDFGFAGFSAKPHIQLAELTGHGPIHACGTPAYVSPEMIRGDAVDARADVYSVGVILYELLTGRLPFDFDTQEELLAAHVQAPPPRFARVGAGDVPAGVEGVVHLALAKYPNERPQTARELAELFGKALRVDLWRETAPVGHTPPPAAAEIVDCTLADSSPAVASPLDKFVLSDTFEGMLPERLAAVKIRGFIEDAGGQAVASEPGLIRVRLDLPPGWKEPADAPQKGSTLFGWLSATRTPQVPKGREPIEMDLQMEKLDPNRVAVLVAFRPLKWHVPDDVRGWKDRCEKVYSVLRKYLMAE